MQASKNSNTTPATQAVKRRGQETMARKLRAAGWTVTPPGVPYPEDRQPGESLLAHALRTCLLYLREAPCGECCREAECAESRNEAMQWLLNAQHYANEVIVRREILALVDTYAAANEYDNRREALEYLIERGLLEVELQHEHLSANEERTDEYWRNKHAP